MVKIYTLKPPGGVDLKGLKERVRGRHKHSRLVLSLDLGAADRPMLPPFLPEPWPQVHPGILRGVRAAAGL
jgi:hypothetical protein